MYGEPQWWETTPWWQSLLWWVLVVAVLIGGPLLITAVSSWWQNRQDTLVRGPYSPLASKPRKRVGFPGRAK